MRDIPQREQGGEFQETAQVLEKPTTSRKSTVLARNVLFSMHEEAMTMAATLHSTSRKLWQTLSSIKTGVILLILVVIISAAGTVILQRPATDPDEMARAYSPQMLRVLDALKLTDVFHAWWFLLLMGLVSLSIVAASIQRFPNAWRFYARPYKSTDETFRKALPSQAQIPIPNEEAGLAAAERALRKLRISPERIVGQNRFSLFGERNRISEMAVYIVHASLLLIFLGGIVDGVFGWSGYLMLNRGEQSNQVALHDSAIRQLPFSVRCDTAGQENYADGTPKKWWSNLAVVQDGKDVLTKQIVVNDPLVYQGVRFYQSSYGPDGKVDKLILTATATTGPASPKDIALGPGEVIQLDENTSVRLAEFIPDYVVRDGQVYTRSAQVENPAVHLFVESKVANKVVNVWLPPIPGFEENASSPYQFEAKDLKMGYFTGLQVSHEPGQWAVWGGVLLMGLGLFVVFYLVHMRVWIVPVRNAQGQLLLWIGGAANKNKDVFDEKFRKLVSEIEAQVKPVETSATAPVATLVAK
jgi:cytochrome c biogenesis protein